MVGTGMLRIKFDFSIKRHNYIFPASDGIPAVAARYVWY